MDNNRQVKSNIQSESGSRDPIFALEALLQIKDGSFGDRFHKQEKKTTLFSTEATHPPSMPLPSDALHRKTTEFSAILPSTIRLKNISCSNQSHSGFQECMERTTFSTPDPLKNQVCDVKSSQFLQPIAPKENKEQTITVRVAEVEAALRSKPQRGKKRDNLNGLERLELTRTRNREHAKNTRIRKKARYEELVENETKYFKLIGKEESNNKLIDHVMKFMDARTEFMNKNIAEESAGIWQISPDGIRDEKNVTSFKDKHNFGTTLYNDVVDNTSCFKYEVMPHSFKSSGYGLVDLQMHDADIVIQVKSKIRKKDDLSFSFLVKKDSISISAANTLFAEFSLQLSSSNNVDGSQHIPLCAGIIQFQFAINSHKITSVMNITTHNYISSMETAASNEDFSLGNGTTFPSVVSLDHTCNLQNMNN